MAREAARTLPDYLPWSILESQSLLSSVRCSGSYLSPGFFHHSWIHERGSSVVHHGLFQYLMIEKTVPGCYFYKHLPKEDELESDLEPLLPPSNQETTKATIEDPVPLRDLLNLRVLIPVLNYTSIAFLHTSSNAIQPLFLAMPISLGGLEFNSRQIGTVLSAYGAANAVLQTFFLGVLVRKFGVKNIFLTAMAMFLPMFGLSPLMNVVARSGGGSGVIWFFLVCQLTFSMVMELGYGELIQRFYHH